MATNEDILIPKVLVLPVTTPLATISGASNIGMLAISGSKLYVCTTGAGVFELVTSTTQ